MKHITLILGLPGSGKTHLAAKIMRDDPKIVLLDDMSRDTDDKIALGRNHDDLIIIDPNLCQFEPIVAMTKLREWFGPYDLETIPFAIDIDQSWANVTKRSDGRVISRSSLVMLAKTYNPEMWGNPRPVWQPDY